MITQSLMANRNLNVNAQINTQNWSNSSTDWHHGRQRGHPAERGTERCIFPIRTCKILICSASLPLRPTQLPFLSYKNCCGTLCDLSQALKCDWTCCSKPSRQGKAIMKKMYFKDHKPCLLEYIKNYGKHERKVKFLRVAEGLLLGTKAHCKFSNCHHLNGWKPWTLWDQIAHLGWEDTAKATGSCGHLLCR